MATKVVKKKATPKKVARKKVVAPPKKKVAAKSKGPAKKTATRKPSTKKASGQSLPRDLNEHGFVKGSDSEKIADILLAGGTDRADINEQVRKAISKKTRNGNPPNTSSLIANVLKRMKAKGYTVESSWVLLPPTTESAAKAKRAAKRAKPKE